MTGSELAAIRKKIGLTAIQWSRALGYSGSDESVRVSISRVEGYKKIPETVARLAYMLSRYGVPRGWTGVERGTT